jgi:quercetin dioxygenase-like cupin family protein
MSEPINKITAAANLWIRQMLFEQAGDIHDGHTHTYDHLTLLAHGRLRVTVTDDQGERKSTDFVAPHMIWIDKGKKHELEALDPGTVAYCVHALRSEESNGSEIIDPDQFPIGITPHFYKLV